MSENALLKVDNLNGSEARKIAEKKRNTILRFLREDLYTIPEVVEILCGIGNQAAGKTLRQMEKLGLLRKSKKKHVIFGKYRHVWGITSKGIEESLMADNTSHLLCSMEIEAFKESIVRKNLDHTLNIQRAKAEALRNDGSWVAERDIEWCYERDRDSRFRTLNKGVHRPDGIATVLIDGHELVYAVEVEQEIKSATTYRENILPGHYKNIAKNHYAVVYYYRETLDLCENLRRKLLGIALGKPAKVDKHGRILKQPKKPKNPVSGTFGYLNDDDVYISMDLTPWEAFERCIKFCDYRGNILDSITEEDYEKEYRKF